MSAETMMQGPDRGASVVGTELLTFVVDGQQYGVDILRVREIRGWEAVTHIPNTPDYVQGVLDLRGAVVPIIDLRARLGMPCIDYDETTVIIVLQVEHREGSRTVGVVVDGVSDVYTAEDDDMRETPRFGPDIDTQLVSGLAAHEDALVVILDIDRLLGVDLPSIDASITQQ